MSTKVRFHQMLTVSLSMLLALTMLFALAAPAAAYSSDGNYTGFFNLSVGGSIKSAVYVNVPCGGNTISASYVWNASKYCFELKVTEGGKYANVYGALSTVNNADVSKVTWNYTSPKTGNGTMPQQTRFANAITTSDKTVSVNLVAEEKIIGSVSTVLDTAVYGRYLIQAADLQEAITLKLTELGYDASRFSFEQQAYTEFTYEGCSEVNFSFDGTKPDTGDSDNSGDIVDGTDKDDVNTCLLKIYGVEFGVTENSPTYSAPYTTYTKPGDGYLILTPQSYGIYPKEGYTFDYWTAFGSDKRDSNTSVYIPSGLQGLSIVAYFKQIQVEDSSFTVQLVDENNEVIHEYIETFSGSYYKPVTITPDETELPAFYLYAEDQQNYTGIVGRPETVQFRVIKCPTYTMSVTKNEAFISASGIGDDAGKVTAGQEYTLQTSDSVILNAKEGYNISKLYIKDVNTGEVMADTTGVWKSVSLTDLFTPVENHKYAVSLLVEKITCTVYFSKNAEYVNAFGIGKDQAVENGVNYKVSVKDGFVLMPEKGYRITKVMVKDVVTGQILLDEAPTNPGYFLIFNSSIGLEEGGRYVVHFNVAADYYTVRFTKNSHLFAAEKISGGSSLTDNTAYSVLLGDDLILKSKSSEQVFTKIYIKDVNTNTVLVNVSNIGKASVNLSDYSFVPEKDHVYNISVLVE